MKEAAFLHPTQVFLQVFLLYLGIAATTTNLATDQTALRSLKASIVEDPFGILSNWTNSTPVCSWIGVTCSSGNQRVTGLDLSNMRLYGTIPSQLGNLSFLASFSIRNNSFSGSLPDQLASLVSLKSLDLGFNSLSGIIPSSLGSLSKLESLSLEANNFAGSFPPSLWNLTSLQSINISNNQIFGSVPSPSFDLSSLQLLNLGFNYLSGDLPGVIFEHLPKLQTLVLSFNQFSGPIPVSLFHCSQLQVLSLSSNNFSGIIPIEVGNLMMLRQLFLKTNRLTGIIPSSIGNCSLLEEIDVSENYLTGVIPSEICDLLNLKNLSMGSNSLHGNIPSALFNLSTIRIVALYTNKLTGSLPPNLGHFLPNLEQLRLAQNELTGIIPSSISNATKLKLIDLSYNSFSGFIPVTLGNLRYLQSLNLANNSLTSESSSSEWSLLMSLASCRNLTKLVLSDNPINAMLPSSIGNLSNSLQQLLANNCNIKGSIPADIGNLTSLIALGLENNDLTGVLPNTVGRLERLQGLYLEGNILQGSIRDDFCQMNSLVELFIGGNKLFGSIPECLGNLTSLRQLNLSSNNFNSSIPSSIWNLKDILSINISSNSLSGPLGSEMGNLNVLFDFDVSNNDLSGEIPYSIGKLESVAFLSLARNNFQGSIPSSLGEALSLVSLDLSHNNLSGEIPMSLQKLKYLTYFNVSFNRLQGKIPDGGAFANFSAQSFMMNKALCGAQRLNVTPCRTNAPKRRTMTTLKLILLLVLPFSGLLLLVSQMILWLIWRRKSRTHVDKYTRERYSYDELKRATDGFSEGTLLGTGRFGSVYKGILEDGLVVAIKVFNLDTPRGLNCFDIESEIMHNICHRSLIRILCSCSSNKFKALVMEYMVNGSLEKWLYTYNYRLDIVQRLDIMTDTALAIQYLHYDYTKSIIHCDLKPSNILLDEDMIAHVSNFGSAKILGHDALASSQEITTTSTNTYMAPEFRVNGTVSAKTDVYSFGILLLETFTGKSPTDEMFSEEKSLRNWAIESLPLDIDKVIDPCLLQTWEEHLDAKLECFSYIIRLAQSCSEESPDERLNMKEVVTGLNRIKHTFLKHISGE